MPSFQASHANPIIFKKSLLIKHLQAIFLYIKRDIRYLAFLRSLIIKFPISSETRITPTIQAVYNVNIII